jgi:translation initiation factor 2-alpha kinase 4
LEDEAWKLFLQIVDALGRMLILGILHRDIKLTIVFIGKSTGHPCPPFTYPLCDADAKGDFKGGIDGVGVL